MRNRIGDWESISLVWGVGDWRGRGRINSAADKLDGGVGGFITTTTLVMSSKVVLF